MCHLDVFISNRVDADEILQFIDKKVKKFIDKFHFKNHTRDVCRTKYDPFSDEGLDGVNTETCEQQNRWIGRYRFAVRHMNESMLFFMLRMAELHNEWTVRLNKNRK